MVSDAISAYDAFGTPAEIQARAARVQQEYDPTVQAGGQVVKDLFSGQMLQDQLKERQPFFDAQRRRLQGVDEAYDREIAETDNQMRAYNLANYGSANQGIGQRRLGAQMRMAKAGDMAARRGDLDVQQEGMKLGLVDAARNLKMANPNLGGQMAQAQTAWSNFPQTELANTQLARSGVLAPHRIRGYSPTTLTPFTQFSPDTSAAGQAGLFSNLFKQGYKQTDGMEGIMGGLKKGWETIFG